jgi:hypothetical protein
MPTVAMFDGIKIQFYWGEHPPPHFHAEYAEYVALIDIRTLEILEGELPKPQYRKVVAWARPRFAELMRAWSVSAVDENPGRIE